METRGAAALWVNIQSMRALPAYDAFLAVAARLCELPALVHAMRSSAALSVKKAATLRDRVTEQLSAGKVEKKSVDRLLPELQALFNLLGHETQSDTYIFLDDFHYLAVKEQPIFLDMVHAVTRDNPVWIKAAGIKHQSRWFTDNPPTGLQTGHDAAIINLDITLEQPAKAKEFLSNILRSYMDEARLGSISGAISGNALDRLVLASGGVPRDFLTLSATAIQGARERSATARAARVQDVNEAAGKIAQVKLQELEDDAASAIGMAQARKDALNLVRTQLLDVAQVTYFRIDFQDKESHAREYELLQSIMDLRLVHLINAGLSDERQAGRRSEVYMLDLSQFSGMRFRRNLRVLDFIKTYLVLKNTGGNASPKLGDTPKKLQSILRRGPIFQLDRLSDVVPQ